MMASKCGCGESVGFKSGGQIVGLKVWSVGCGESVGLKGWEFNTHTHTYTHTHAYTHTLL